MRVGCAKWRYRSGFPLRAEDNWQFGQASQNQAVAVSPAQRRGWNGQPRSGIAAVQGGERYHILEPGCPDTQAVVDAVAEGRGRGWSAALAEDVLEEEPESGRRLLFREDVLYQCEDLGDCVQIEHFGELLDVLCVAGPRGERLHREEMFG